MVLEPAVLPPPELAVLTLKKTLWYSQPGVSKRHDTMRVIAGAQKGRRLEGPKGYRLRPTAERVKEALFSILGPRLIGARFLDLYAGTGSIGIEALSRGAQGVTFVEQNPACLSLLRTNLARCRLTEMADVHACSAARFLARHKWEDNPYDIVFADPPYRADEEIDVLPLLGQPERCAHGLTVVVEHPRKLDARPQVGRLTRLRQYRYGDTTLSVYGSDPAGTRTP